MTGHRFDAELWRWEAKPDSAGWFFVTVPEDVSDELEARTEGRRRGFGSVKVRVRVGTSTWETSVFPDSKRGAFVLPVKASVRGAEGLDEGSVASLELVAID